MIGAGINLALALMNLGLAAIVSPSPVALVNIFIGGWCSALAFVCWWDAR